MIIIYTSKFEKEYKNLPQEIKDLTIEKEAIFRSNPFERSLGTHKLNGKLKDYWSWSIDYKYRIIFWFKTQKEIWFLSVGTHDIYY